MNYIAQLKGFRRKRLSNPISANSICLYFILLEYANEINFLDWFIAPNSTLQGLTGLSISALQKARNELITKSYINYKKGSGNTAGKYSITNLTACFEQQSEQQFEQQSDNKANSSTGIKVNTLTKLNETKLNNKKNNKKISPQKEKHKYGEYKNDDLI